MLNFVFKKLDDNKFKIFRWKLFHKILTNNQILFKWKLKETPLCNICNEIDDYEHLFINCRYFKEIRIGINKVLAKFGYTNNILNLKTVPKSNQYPLN